MATNLSLLNDSLEKKLSLSGDLASNISLEIKAICFLNLIAKTENSLNDIDFSDRDNTYKVLDNISKKLQDNNLSEILNDINQSNIFTYSKALNEVYLELQKLNEKELLDLFDLSTEKYRGKVDGNWSTSKQISEVILDYVDVNKAESILDLCSGEGYLLSKCVDINPNLKVTGYEIYTGASLISKMRLYLHQANYYIYNADILQTKLNDKYDVVFADYPWAIHLNEEPVNDSNMIVSYNKKLMRSDWNFMLKAINAIKETGKAIALAPLGILWSTNNADETTRKEIIDKGLLESIMIMPAGTYQGTMVSYCLMVFSYHNSEVKFIDASDAVIDTKSAYKTINNELIHDLLHASQSEKIKLIPNEEIKDLDYSLEYKRYFNNLKEIKLINPKKLNEISEVFSGYQYTSKNLTELEPGEGNISILKVTNVEDGMIDYESMVSANIDESKVEKYLLKENDILLASKGTVFKLAVVTNIGDKKVIPHNNFSVIRITDQTVNPVYVCNYLNSSTGRSFLESIQTGSIIKMINKNALLELSVPILDQDTQEVIANRYTILKNNAQELKLKLNSVLEKLNSIYEDEVGD